MHRGGLADALGILADDQLAAAFVGVDVVGREERLALVDFARSSRAEVQDAEAGPGVVASDSS